MDEEELASGDTKTMLSNPIIIKLNDVFDKVTNEIQANGDNRVNFLLTKIKNKPGMNMNDYYKHQETVRSQFTGKNTTIHTMK